LELHGQAHVSAHLEAAGHHTGWNIINTCGLMGHQLHNVQSPDHNIILTDAVVSRWHDTALSIRAKGPNLLMYLRLEIKIRIFNLTSAPTCDYIPQALSVGTCVHGLVYLVILLSPIGTYVAKLYPPYLNQTSSSTVWRQPKSWLMTLSGMPFRHIFATRNKFEIGCAQSGSNPFFH
jgi:hypothetical protein